MSSREVVRSEGCRRWQPKETAGRYGWGPLCSTCAKKDAGFEYHSFKIGYLFNVQLSICYPYSVSHSMLILCQSHLSAGQHSKGRTGKEIHLPEIDGGIILVFLGVQRDGVCVTEAPKSF